MFENAKFDVYDFNSIPLDRDMYLVDHKYAAEYEASYLALFDGKDFESIGYVSCVAADKVHENTVELTWYPNTFDRFHQVPIILPKENIICCVGCWRYDWDPTIFVESSFIESLYAKIFSIFCLIDVAGVKKALERDAISRSKLLSLRDLVDKIASSNRDVSFTSFGDSVLLKSNYTMGSITNELDYTYAPENIIRVAKSVVDSIKDSLGLPAYSIFAQGYNEYYDDELLHVSESKNHVSLNSLGIPFAHLLAIDDAARRAIRSGAHDPAEVYMDSGFYHSLKFESGFEKSSVSCADYDSPMSARQASYFLADFTRVLGSLETK